MTNGEMSQKLLGLAKGYVLAATIAGGIGSGVAVLAMRLGIVEVWPGGGPIRRTAALEASVDTLNRNVAEWHRMSLDSDDAMRRQILRLDSLQRESAVDRRDLRRSQDVLLWFDCLNGPVRQPNYVRMVCDRVLNR